MIQMFHSSMSVFPWEQFYDLMLRPNIIAPQLEDGAEPLTREEMMAQQADPGRTIWLIREEETPLGFIMFRRRGVALKELHTGWQAGSGKLRRAVWTFVRDKEFLWGTHTIVAIVPAFNHRARYMAVAIGFRRTGVLPQSFLKDGIMHNQTLYAITKGE